jgi:cell division protein FtsI (penicillin-binding protein 3)/stage V sporulation protein D (sporulation-specific penicillin-binding protein)
MRRSFRFRLRILAGIVVFIAFFLILRLYFVQIIHGSDYALRANRQYLSSSQQLYDRGTIYFTQKDGTLISAATLATGFVVAIDPEAIKDPQSVYDALSAQMTLDPTAFFASAAKTSDPYEVLAHHVSEPVGEAIAALNIPGVLVERERWRIYPAGTEAAQTLGFIAYDKNNLQTGQAGLEESHETVLARSSQGLFGNFFAELFANLNNVVADARSTTEGDVVTSIEPLVEQHLDEDLKAVNDQYHSTESAGIIMEAKTGKIIAMDSYPTFDPNDFQHGDPQYFGNGLVQHEYEFGSIVKSLTMASGLDAGVITPQSTYNDTGCIHPNNTTVCNFDLKARGVIPMDQILFQSLNLGASFIADKLGHERMRDYFIKLGFNQKTGIDLPGEVAGDIRNLNTAQDVNYDTAAFGQGIAVTPVEMVKALDTLANNGVTVSPHVTTAIQLETGIVKPVNYPKGTQVFSPQAVQEVSTMLQQVFKNDAKLAIAANPGLAMPTVTVTAKTGTAQVVDGTGGYYKNVFFHSFFGYFPANDPEYIILLYTNRPQGVEYASGTLTKTFMDLTNFMVNYYNIPPDTMKIQ